MKVAGGLLTGLGVFLILVTFLYQNDTGNSSVSTLLGGVVLLIVGIIVMMIKPKGKKDQ